MTRSWHSLAGASCGYVEARCAVRCLTLPSPHVLARTAAVLALLGIARWKGVNLSALGIGVDFLQVVSLFSSFGFAWPPQLTALFAASSAASFNDQLVAPECSIGTWSFSRKYDLFGRGASACRRVGRRCLLHFCTTKLYIMRLCSLVNVSVSPRALVPSRPVLRATRLADGTPRKRCHWCS